MCCRCSCTRWLALTWKPLRHSSRTPPARSRTAKDLVRHLLLVDPRARYSALDVLKHRWVAGGNASAKPLPGTIGGLTKIQAGRTRFRGAVQSVIATMKLGKLRAASGAGAGMELEDEAGAGV